MLITYQVQNTSDDIPYSLHFVRGKFKAGHGGVNGFIIASVGTSYFAVADKIISGWITD